MNRCWIALAAVLVALAGCATGPGTSSAKKPEKASWNTGVWNSAMGYHGPANSMELSPR